MVKPARSKAEERFATVGRRGKRALSEMEQSWRERQEKLERLRALRLAKEAADKKAAEKAAAKKTAAKNKKPSRLRQAHRS